MHRNLLVMNVIDEQRVCKVNHSLMFIKIVKARDEIEMSRDLSMR